MRLASLFVLLAAGSLVACSADEAGGIVRKGHGAAADGDAKAGGSEADPSGGASGGAASAAVCPSDVTAPVQIATDADATNVRVVGDAVYFQTSTKVVRVGKDGTGRKEIYESADLVRAFADGGALLTIESPDPPNASLKVTGATGNTFEIGTDLNAASTYAFAADANGFYVLTDSAEGDVIYRLDKRNPQGLETIAEIAGVVSSPQIAGGALWYVVDQTHVMKLALDGGGAPAEVFAIGGGTCNLAIDPGHAYCATSSAIEARDLVGGTSTTLLDSQKSKVRAPFGSAISASSGIVVLSKGEGTVKNLLRSVSAAGAERIVACGRDTIDTSAADATSVAWSEAGKGVFLAPR